MLLVQDAQLLPVARRTGVARHDRPRDRGDGGTGALPCRLPHTVVVVGARHGWSMRSLAARVTVLHEGSVLADGTDPIIVQSQQTVIDVYLGR